MKALMILALAFVPAATYAVDMKELQSDLVELKDGKMIYESAQLCTKKSDADISLQAKLYAEAKADGFISRDQFVAGASILGHILVDGMKQGISEDMKCKTLDEMIGNPDMSVNMYMNKTGIQIEIMTSSTAPQRITKKWDEI